MSARLYGMEVSHPANAARLMLEHKGIPHDVTNIPPGAQEPWVRLAGFPGGTVPALRLPDGRKVQGSLAISRALDDFQADPPLFPADPGQRQKVEDAELWAERELQPVPRRLLRWALAGHHDVRVTFTRQLGIPLAPITAHAMTPVARWMARAEEANLTERIRADWMSVPGHLDHVDALVADGVLDGEQLNAADFQIGSTLRVMLSFADFAPLLEDRPAAVLALRVWPTFDQSVPPLVSRALV